MSSDLLSTNEAAAMLSVGASTVKRWADEGRLECVKTAGGHRRFPRHAVAAMLDATASAESEEISTKQLLADNDGHATLALLYQLRSKYGAWWVVAEHVANYLRTLGEAWAEGKVSIVEEHTISERILRAIAAACQAIPTSGVPRTCLFVMVEGDDHTLGLRLAELVAREAGWQSRWVGRKTPLEELPALLAGGQIHAVAASASSFSSNEIALAGQAKILAEMTSAASLPLALGGDGSWPVSPAYGSRVTGFEDFRAFLLAASQGR